jgi:hypothetical protein
LTRKNLALTLVIVVLLILTAVLAGLAPVWSLITPIQRSDPLSVLNGYFEAWQHHDWARESSLLARPYRGGPYEPVQSLRVVSIRPLASSRTRRTYEVVFDVDAGENPISMSSGRYDWTYELRWNGGEHSWLITSLGME